MAFEMTVQPMSVRESTFRLDDGTTSIVVRKGLGVHEAVPNHWPEAQFAPTTIEPLYGDPVKLDRAVARA